MRNLATLVTLATGTTLAIVSYFVFAAPLGQQTDPSFSNPRVEFAATFFVAGIAVAIGSAIVYELMPESE